MLNREVVIIKSMAVSISILQRRSLNTICRTICLAILGDGFEWPIDVFYGKSIEQGKQTVRLVEIVVN
jgi:hypothetical protein